MTDLLQHGIVTVVALLAAWVLLRHVFGVFAPASRSGPGCASCAAGQAACGHAAAPSPAAPLADDGVAPLTLHRRPPVR